MDHRRLSAGKRVSYVCAHLPSGVLEGQLVYFLGVAFCSGRVSAFGHGHCDVVTPDATQPAAGTDIGLQLDLVKALGRLSIEQREALLLVTLEQLSYAECAEVLRIPIGTVMSRVSRARIALRALLDGKGAVPPGTLRRVV